jgi:putative alpha-1,2-mannosidase
MDIQVRPLTSFEGSDWEVRMKRLRITFRTESEARSFAQTLQTRLTAPHCLPLPSDKSTDGANGARTHVSATP